MLTPVHKFYDSFLTFSTGSFYRVLIWGFIWTPRKWVYFVFNGINHCWRNWCIWVQTICADGYASWKASRCWYKAWGIHENLHWWLFTHRLGDCLAGLLAWISPKLFAYQHSSKINILLTAKNFFNKFLFNIFVEKLFYTLIFFNKIILRT